MKENHSCYFVVLLANFLIILNWTFAFCGFYPVNNSQSKNCSINRFSQIDKNKQVCPCPAAGNRAWHQWGYRPFRGYRWPGFYRNRPSYWRGYYGRSWFRDMNWYGWGGYRPPWYYRGYFYPQWYYGYYPWYYWYY